MKVGIILPHLKAFGGVRRFIEVGQHLQARGHEVTIHAATGGDIRWAAPWSDLRISGIRGHRIGDDGIVLIGDPPSFKYLVEASTARMIYVWVIAGGEYIPMYKRLYLNKKKNVRFLLNNRAFKKDFPEARWCEGGTNTEFFTPKKIRRVGYYVGAGRVQIKGEAHIEKELGSLPGIELVPLKGLSSIQLREAYRSLDYFVSWEQRMGWSNTAAEALACGIPVVGSGANCEPFEDRIIKVKSLRQFFSNPMEDLDWSGVANRLEDIWKGDKLIR